MDHSILTERKDGRKNQRCRLILERKRKHTYKEKIEEKREDRGNAAAASVKLRPLSILNLFMYPLTSLSNDLHSYLFIFII